MRNIGSQGQIALYILLGIIILGAFLIVSGGPEFKLSETGNPTVGEPIIETPPVGQDSLQLRDIKFKECESQLNIDLLLDRSGSMNNTTGSGVKKIDALKSAVTSLTNTLGDDSIIGIQSFDSGSTTNDVPINFYKNVKSTIPPAIQALTPGSQTPTHDALAFSYDKLLAAKSKFAGKKITFIFVTDGIPVPPTQDPRLFNPNPADQIKALGFPIYTIGVHSPSDGNSNDFSGLLKSVASTPANYYEAPTGDEITKLLAQIKEKICNTDMITPNP